LAASGDPVFRAREVLECAGVGHLVHAIAQQQVAGKRAGRWVVTASCTLSLPLRAPISRT